MEIDRLYNPLRMATEEIVRICEEIDSLTRGLKRSGNAWQNLDSYVLAPNVDDSRFLKIATTLIRARDRRSKFFPMIEFADPAWDIILDLFVAKLAGRSVSVSSACIGARVPSTTALRYLSALTAKGTIERKYDPRDGRRILLELSDRATDGMRAYLRAEVDGQF